MKMTISQPARRIKQFLLGLMLAATIFATGCVQVPISGEWNYGMREIPIYDKSPVGQDFFVSDRNLTRVDIFFYPSKALEGIKKAAKRKRIIRANLKGKFVVMKLFSLPDRRQLVSFKLPVGKIEEDKMYTFVFKPIVDSKRKRYYVELAAPDLAYDLSVSARLNGTNPYKKGRVYINGQPEADSDLGFKTYIDMTSRQLLHSVAARLVADPVFMVVWALLVSIISAVAIVIWRQASTEAKEIRTAD